MIYYESLSGWEEVKVIRKYGNQVLIWLNGLEKWVHESKLREIE